MGTLTKTLLQNLEVLSAGQDYKKDAEGKPIAVQVVNLLVTPEQAEQLSLASNQTAIQLILRNPLDHDVAKTPGTALSYLFTGMKGKPHADEPQPSAQPRPRAASGTALRAASRSRPAGGARRKKRRSSWKSFQAPARPKPSSTTAGRVSKC